jgi:uncharacterized protein (DUF4415 family)
MSLPSIALSLALAAAATPTSAPAPAPAPAAKPTAAAAPAPPAAAAPVAADTSNPAEAPIPKKVPSPVSEDNAPTVTIRSSDSGDVIEEYREGGKIYMVRITPVRGKPYYLYDDDRNGRMDRTDADKASVSPVYWTIYEWD